VGGEAEGGAEGKWLERWGDGRGEEVSAA
jgi:hypothetical protein